MNRGNFLDYAGTRSRSRRGYSLSLVVRFDIEETVMAG
jgi:hypothetical protein